MKRSCACYMIAIFCLVAFSCKKEKPNQQPPVQDSTIQQPPVQNPTTTGSYKGDEIEGFKQMTVYITKQVAKWRSPVLVYVADTSFLYLTAQIDSAISEVNALLDTNLTIKRVSTRDGSSIQVYFTDENTYLKLEPAVAALNLHFIGFGYTAWDSSWNINHGSLFVDTAATANDTAFQRFIVYHEFMHTLGFPGHLNMQLLSSVMFSYAQAPYLTNYTAYDEKMIRWLYNPSVTTGMNETELDVVIDSL